MSPYSFRNLGASFLAKTFYPVVKGSWLDIILQAPFMVGKTAGAALHNQSVLFICRDTGCSHNLASKSRVKCLRFASASNPKWRKMLAFPICIMRLDCYSVTPLEYFALTKTW